MFQTSQWCWLSKILTRKMPSVALWWIPMMPGRVGGMLGQKERCVGGLGDFCGATVLLARNLFTKVFFKSGSLSAPVPTNSSSGEVSCRLPCLTNRVKIPLVVNYPFLILLLRNH